MERELKDLQNFFALIELKAFCKKYDLSYEYTRKVLRGDSKFPLKHSFCDKILVAMNQFEIDQLELKKQFRFNFEV